MNKKNKKNIIISLGVIALLLLVVSILNTPKSFLGNEDVTNSHIFGLPNSVAEDENGVLLEQDLPSPSISYYISQIFSSQKSFVNDPLSKNYRTCLLKDTKGVFSYTAGDTNKKGGQCDIGDRIYYYGVSGDVPTGALFSESLNGGLWYYGESGELLRFSDTYLADKNFNYEYGCYQCITTIPPTPEEKSCLTNDMTQCVEPSNGDCFDYKYESVCQDHIGSDKCSSGDTECSGNFILECKKDNNGFLDFEVSDSCDYGCSNGECNPSQNECSTEGVRECDGNYVVECKESSDGSLKLDSIESCDYQCSDGSCINEQVIDNECGDNICQSFESYSTCSHDCKSPDNTPVVIDRTLKQKWDDLSNTNKYLIGVLVFGIIGFLFYFFRRPKSKGGL